MALTIQLLQHDAKVDVLQPVRQVLSIVSCGNRTHTPVSAYN